MNINIGAYAEGADKLDGFESAIIGIAVDSSGQKRVLYDKRVMLKILQEKRLMTGEEASEYLDCGIIPNFGAGHNALFLEVEIEPQGTHSGLWFYKVK
jgi:hypothetical protein